MISGKDMNRNFLVSLAALSLIPVSALHAQRAYPAQAYAQAERWMGYNVNPLVAHTVSDVKYLPDGRVFLRDPAAGTEERRGRRADTSRHSLCGPRADSRCNP